MVEVEDPQGTLFLLNDARRICSTRDRRISGPRSSMAVCPYDTQSIALRIRSQPRTGAVILNMSTALYGSRTLAYFRDEYIFFPLHGKRLAFTPKHGGERGLGVSLTNSLAPLQAVRLRFAMSPVTERVRGGDTDTDSAIKD
ncbi:hypothetical protein RRG08_057317 [Elysia crispata]|uniref:Uncharacterized protein n=1 Tax=Elysia crispata TaxID=231223 RepID=A0AAE1CSJ9_9GAST|nr:hypothetical protein RRG08_057317 [Elysia crispata]